MVDKTGTIGTACSGTRLRRGHFTVGGPAMHVTSQMVNSPGDLFPARTRLCYRGFLRTNAASVVFSTRTRGTRLQMMLSFLLSEIDYNAPTAFGVPLGTLILFLWLMSNNNRRRDD